MKKIIPFKKDIIFKTNLSEITSISLEHTLHLDSDNLITGEFIVSGEYKMADSSINTECFSFNLPFDISMDNKYILDNVAVDIDDFYYEIVNNNILSINIEVLIDKIEERPLLENKPLLEEDSMLKEKKFIIDNLTIDDEPIDDGEVFDYPIKREEENDMREEAVSAVKEENDIKQTSARSFFDSFDNSAETYTTYKICIVREGDNIEVLLQRYGISKEELEKYNDLKEIKIGDKIIIPSLVNEKN